MEKIKETLNYLNTKIDNFNPEIAIILGSGLSVFCDNLKGKSIKYNDIPNFPHSSVSGHKGELLYCNIEGKNCAIMQGRFHYYEGYSLQDCTFAIKVLKMAGIKTLIITNAAGGINKNYNIIVNDGKSTVNKADLVVDLNKVYHTYGEPNLKDYGIDKVEGLTNGDKISEDKLAVEMTKDNALKDNNKHTNNAGDYTWTGSVDGIEGLEDNYNITINPGKSTVDKGHLTITVDDSNTTVGDNPSYGGTVDGWVNGDNPNDFDINFGLDDDTILDQPGKHDGVIGVIIDGTFYPSGTEDDIFNNYDVTISTGDLTVLKPIDINDYKNWSHLYKDAPWDRNRDFKERKAEFNFVDGAIPLDEAVEEA